MVVCVCNAIRERELRDVARSGELRSAKAAYAQLGRKPQVRPVPVIRSQYHQRRRGDRLIFLGFPSFLALA